MRFHVDLEPGETNMKRLNRVAENLKFLHIQFMILFGADSEVHITSKCSPRVVQIMIKKVEPTKLLTALLEPCSSKNGGAGMLEENPSYDNERCVQVWLLEHFSGSRSIFKHQRKDRGYKITLKISEMNYY